MQHAAAGFGRPWTHRSPLLEAVLEKIVCVTPSVCKVSPLTAISLAPDSLLAGTLAAGVVLNSEFVQALDKRSTNAALPLVPTSHLHSNDR